MGGNGFQKAAGPFPSAFSDDGKLANFRGGFILARQPTANQTMVLLMMTMMILLSVTVRRKGSRASGRDGLFLENELDEGGVEIVSDFPVLLLLHDEFVFESVDFLLQLLNGTFSEFSAGLSLL